MAATTVGSVAIHRSPAPRAAPLGRRATMLLPGFVGLRMSARIPRGSCVMIPAASARAIRRRGAVVCEAQETSVQLSGSSGAAVGVPEVSKATWQSLVMESDIPVLVDFWAPWCGPCRLIEPVIVQLSERYEGKLKCYKLNTDENPDITTQYGVRSIPTMMIFKNGEKKDAVIGAVPESTLISSIEKFVSR